MLQTLQTNAYSNWVMLDPTGLMLCRCAEKRARWYLDRNLAEMVSDNPPTIKLSFVPGGPGYNGDSYSMAEKENRCVVCGTVDDLTKHHIVPHMFRKCLPIEMKGRSSHDVVVICVSCHNEYEEVATQLKKTIADEHGVQTLMFKDEMPQHVRDHRTIVSLCHALYQQSDNIPVTRQNEIVEKLTLLLGHVPTHDEVEQYAYDKRWLSEKRDPGKIIMDVIIAKGLVDEFVKRWRQHFLDIAKPQFMPKFWDVNRPLLLR